MEEIKSYEKTYAEYKQELDRELNRTAEGFVRIGYLLKVARDTDVLKESGYGNVTDFAKAEYGIDKTQVSRFISINDRFSEGGYSDHLQTGYQNFGYAKLTLMLQLPEAINEELSPDFSKAEIQAIKDEVDAERDITDIEVAIEAAEAAVAEKPLAAPEGTVLERTLWQLFKEQKELFCKLWDICREERTTQEIMDVLAPQGEALYSVRIPGTGKLQLIINGAGSSVVNVRTMEKTRYEKEELAAAVQDFIREGESQEALYLERYGEALEEKQEVAPVQQREEKKAPVKRESKVITSPKLEKKAEQEKKESERQEPAAGMTPEAQEEMQVPGQTDIETDFPEYMPQAMPPELVEEQRTGYMNLLRDAAESIVRYADMGLWKAARQQVSEIVKHLTELERLPEVKDE